MPLTVEDRLDIQDLLARYNQAIDGGDGEAWAETFAPDGIFHSDRRGTHQGRETLAAFARERHADGGPRRHWTNNVVIEGDGDEATMRVYLLMLSVDGAPELMGTARYEDQLRRIDGAWKFVRRDITTDVPVA